ncbi:hypothetical protein JCM6882_001696 [Rhodosporidiobolus microsporus]
MPPEPPLRLNHSLNSYLVASVAPSTPSNSSATAPPPPPSLPPSLIEQGVSYVGRIGPGNMANELVFALPKEAAGTSSGANVEEVKRAMSVLDGVKAVEVLQAKQRTKR